MANILMKRKWHRLEHINHRTVYITNYLFSAFLIAQLPSLCFKRFRGKINIQVNILQLIRRTRDSIAILISF